MAMISGVCAASEQAVAIRQGQLKDFKPLLAIEREAFGRHALDPSTIFWLLLRHWPGLMVAEDNDTMLGYVISRISLYPWLRKTGGITSIAVRASCRNKGVGRRLMYTAMAFLKNAGATQIELEVHIENKAAISLYRGLGFSPKVSLPDYYGAREDGIRMVLDITNLSPGTSREFVAKDGKKTGDYDTNNLTERGKMADCIFCKVASGDIESKKVYEDEDIVAFQDINKKAPVHFLIIPRKHIASLSELSPDDDELIGKVHRIAAKLAKDNDISESGFRLVANTGRDAGQSVGHIHFHLLGGRQLGWPPG